MNPEETLRLIGAGRVVAILRGDFGGADADVAGVLVDAGITALELTVDSPDAFRRISSLATAFGDQLAVGAGTVMDTRQVARAVDAGAAFMVSPNRDVSVITAAVSAGMVAVPGCMTPSEIVEAVSAGAQAVKLFPAQSLGPDFVRSVLAPLPRLRLVPTGGVNAENGKAYRAAGAWAVGAGSELVGRGVPGAGGLARIASRARALREAMA